MAAIEMHISYGNGNETGRKTILHSFSTVTNENHFQFVDA